jgi:eukaryotic-like serine/threonine-protein kinase
MAESPEESSKSSSLTDLTLEVRQPGAAEQEVFLQHGLSLGRNPSNSLCINHPDVERIHAQVLRQADGSMLLECASPTTQISLADGKKVHELLLKPGTTFKIGPATVRCLKRQTKAAVVVTDNPWQVRCPRCHEVLADLSHDAHKCPACKTELFYFREKTAKNAEEDAGFQGWLPKFVGPYAVRAFVAQGGMGIVLRGLHKENDMPAAVKLLKGDPDHDPSWKARFEAEVNTLTSLKHPNVVRLQAHGRDDKLLWLAMDWIDGVPMGSWITKARNEQKNLPIDQIRSAMNQVISGLQYLHGRQIIHRDLKPNNILVAQDDLVKMVDFGIARSSSGSTNIATRLTQTGMVTGTESYMAPEQAEGREVTPASDIYALGVIWYELLTGRRPMGTFVSPELVRPDTPAAWSRAISQCLAMDARLRPSLESLSASLAGVTAPPPIPTSPGFSPVTPGGSGAAAGGATVISPPPIPPGYSPPTQPGIPNPPPPGHPGHSAAAIAGEKAQEAAKLIGKASAAGAHAVGEFLHKHPPKELAEKLGPLAQAARKNPKIWIGGGIAAVVIIILLIIHSLPDNSTPKTGTATNTPAQNAPNPAPAAPNPLQQQAAVAPPQGDNPPANPQISPQQMQMLKAQAYQAAYGSVSRQVMLAQILNINDPRVSINSDDGQTFQVQSLCYGYFPNQGMATVPFTCTIHRTPDGQWSADPAQF